MTAGGEDESAVRYGTGTRQDLTGIALTATLFGIVVGSD